MSPLLRGIEALRGCLSMCALDTEHTTKHALTEVIIHHTLALSSPGRRGERLVFTGNECRRSGPMNTVRAGHRPGHSHVSSSRPMLDFAP